MCWTLFLGLDTDVELYKGGIVPLSEFAWSKRDNDILVGLIVKKRPVQIVYQSLRLSRTDFPVLASAVVCLDGKWRAVIGARPQRALLIEDEENLLGGGLTEENIRKFAAYVKEKRPRAPTCGPERITGAIWWKFRCGEHWRE